MGLLQTCDSREGIECAVRSDVTHRAPYAHLSRSFPGHGPRSMQRNLPEYYITAIARKHRRARIRKDLKTRQTAKSERRGACMRGRQMEEPQRNNTTRHDQAQDARWQPDPDPVQSSERRRSPRMVRRPRVVATPSPATCLAARATPAARRVATPTEGRRRRRRECVAALARKAPACVRERGRG